MLFEVRNVSLPRDGGVGVRHEVLTERNCDDGVSPLVIGSPMVSWTGDSACGINR